MGAVQPEGWVQGWVQGWARAVPGPAPALHRARARPAAMARRPAAWRQVAAERQKVGSRWAGRAAGAAGWGAATGPGTH